MKRMSDNQWANFIDVIRHLDKRIEKLEEKK